MCKSRINREKRTIKLMIELYCRKNHCVKLTGKFWNGLFAKEKLLKTSKVRICENCSELLDYALSKLNSCPVSANKPACNNCIVHCYKPIQREEIKKIMRFSGPKMLLRHPYLAIMHIIDLKKSIQKK